MDACNYACDLTGLLVAVGSQMAGDWWVAVYSLNRMLIYIDYIHTFGLRIFLYTTTVYQTRMDRCCCYE